MGVKAKALSTVMCSLSSGRATGLEWEEGESVNTAVLHPDGCSQQQSPGSHIWSCSGSGKRSGAGGHPSGLQRSSSAAHTPTGHRSETFPFYLVDQLEPCPALWVWAALPGTCHRPTGSAPLRGGSTSQRSVPKASFWRILTRGL